MSNLFLASSSPSQWSAPKRFILRIAAVFFLLTLFAPLDWKFWRTLFHSNLLHFQDIFRLIEWLPQYFYAPKWGFASFRSVLLVLLISAVVGTAWSYLDRERVNSEALYYWLQVLLRYRLAIAIIGYGLIQFFPIQFPKPTLSDLHTNYGDYLQWKMYYITAGIAHAHYEEALGLLEIIAGALLFSRKTATIGAIIAGSLLFNIVLANFAYQLGDHVYATLLLITASVILLHDAARLIGLLVQQRATKAERFVPSFTPETLRVRRWAKSAAVLLLLLYGVSVAYAYKETNWPYPSTPGTLASATGYYNVREFSVNGREIPYSLTDPVRWQNVVFERWNTISMRSNRPFPLEVQNPRPEYANGLRTYEYAGNGGRRFYSYVADPAGKTLTLQGKSDPHEKIVFRYSYDPDGALELNGTDESGNNLHIVLNKIDKRYLLLLGRRHPVTVY